VNGLPVEIQALVLAELAKRLKTGQAATKAIVGGRYEPGDKQTFRSPLDDAKLGTVFRSDPDPEWRIVDSAATLGHLREDPANVESYFEIGDEQSAIDVLHNVAPHLLIEVERVKPAAIDAAVERARQGEQVPGVERVKPEGVLSVRPDKNAGEAIERMVQAGVITWDGRPVLEAGREAS
jgi:hypothetical protein